MKLTPSQVKNLMGRGLRLLVDPEPEPEQKERCIAFFKHRCAYCGAAVNGQGDLDHLLSAAQGGRNHISNRVFSCKECNSKGKRDRPWEQFLLERSGTGEVMESRRQKITEWISLAGAIPPLTEGTIRAIEEESQKATRAYDKACERVRSAQQETI